jgi:hypothetical protein
MKTPLHRLRLARTCGVVCATLIAVSTGVPSATATASPDYTYGVGSTTLATPAQGSRYIYVATNGSDTHTEYKAWLNDGAGGYRVYGRLNCLTDPDWATTSQEVCPEPSRENPLKTIKLAIRVAHPGDVIVVREGTYVDDPGYGAVPGTSQRPIVLQSQPGEKVVLSGTLLLKGADYWTVSGMSFVGNSTVQGNGAAVVHFSGGTGWRFLNNEVRSTTGVANVLVTAESTSSTSTSTLTAVAPHDYTIAANCIHDQQGNGTHGQYHNVYLLSTHYSSGGLIERNLLADAPDGANIKVAASSKALTTQSPHDVTIRYNTMVRAASGITIGLTAEDVLVERNIIAFGLNSTEYDGAVKTYQFAQPTRSMVQDNLFSHYNKNLEKDWNAATPIPMQRNTDWDDASLSGASTCDRLLEPRWVRAGFGHLAETVDGSFIDDNLSTHEGATEAVREAGITYGCDETRFCAFEDVSRAQMAAFLRRALDLPRSDVDHFSDDDGLTLERDINAIYEAGITFGCAEGKFCPNETVSREQMAAFLTRAFDLPGTNEPFFTDVEDSTFTSSINALAASGITYGCDDGIFCPKDPVKRDQMASFFARALGLKAIAAR